MRTFCSSKRIFSLKHSCRSLKGIVDTALHFFEKLPIFLPKIPYIVYFLSRKIQQKVPWTVVKQFRQKYLRISGLVTLWIFQKEIFLNGFPRDAKKQYWRHYRKFFAKRTGFPRSSLENKNKPDICSRGSLQKIYVNIHNAVLTSPLRTFPWKTELNRSLFFLKKTTFLLRISPGNLLGNFDGLTVIFSLFFDNNPLIDLEILNRYVYWKNKIYRNVFAEK